MAFLERNANRGSVSTGYDVDNSVKLEPDNSEYFQRAATGSDGSLTTWTFSLWLKRTELSHACIFYSQGGNGRVRFESDDTFSFRYKSGHEFTTTRRFRDCASWYHIVIAVDTTQSTASNRIKIYINGVQETMSGTQPDQNETSDFGEFGSITAQLGQFTEGSYYFSGYMTEFYWIDGIQQLPTKFGTFDSDSNIWKPIEYTGSFGNEGAYLDFEDASQLGKDVSGNGNHYTEQAITSIDQATDTCTNNFCTMNHTHRTNGNIRCPEGGTKVETDGGSGYCSIVGTMGMSKGKWYWEVKFHNHSGNTNTVFLGLVAANDPWIPSRQGGYYLGNIATHGNTGWYFVNGAVYNGSGTWTDDAGNGPGYGDILMVAYDADNTTLYFGKNGTWLNSSNPANNSNGIELSAYYWSADPTYVDYAFPAVTVYQGNYVRSFNFGSICTWDSQISSGNADADGYGNFEYAPPSGFYSLCSKNLAEHG